MHADNAVDLIVVVADADAQQTLEGVLRRRESLGTRQITFQIDRFVRRDAGCYRQVQDYLRPFTRQYAHALVVFDRHGCGQEDRSPEELERDVEARLAQNGWKDRCAVVVIDPELEAWVWSNSAAVSSVLGWGGDNKRLRKWLENQGQIGIGDTKPADPKASLRMALREVSKRPSPFIFRQLAERVSLNRCSDPSFDKLRSTLQHWFSDS